MYLIFGKRVFDIFASLCCCFLLSPIILFIILLIILFDNGPVFFVQKRVGKNGVLFLFYKFRSMPVDTGDKPSDELVNVSISWVGKIIRRTNLDELPQLLNIFKGDMSFVGPRPPIPSQKELVKYRISNGSLYVLPGLTGLAQIKSFNGMTVIQKASFDGEYAEEITFWGDLKILLKTFLYLFKPPPIY